VVVEPASAMMAPVLVILSVVVLRRPSRHRWCRRRGIALIRCWRVRTRTLRSPIGLWWVASAHWSSGIARRPVVEAHPDRWAHWLCLGGIMMTSPAPTRTIWLLVKLVWGGM
jgi:hypothetical protein